MDRRLSELADQLIAAYIYLQKYMVEGLTAGGVKG
jgi:ABC-type maltose transport system permease subunit